MVIEFDGTGRITYANAEAEKKLEYRDGFCKAKALQHIGGKLSAFAIHNHVVGYVVGVSTLIQATSTVTAMISSVTITSGGTAGDIRTIWKGMRFPSVRRLSR